MPDLTLKNLPDDVHAALKERAAHNRRSLNSEAIACLEAAVRADRLDVDAILAEARRLRRRVRGRITDRHLRAFKAAGRP